MKARDFEATLKHTPFRRFTIHVDGLAIDVDHPEQVLLTPDKSTVVVATADNGFRIIDVDLISSLSLRPRGRSAAKAAS